MFIVFEGMDASGKATQSKRLTAFLSSQHTHSRRIEMPTYDTEPAALAGPVIADHLHGKWSASWDVPDPRNAKMPYNFELDAFVFQCVMLANKYEMAPTIEQGLSGGHVVCDRYWPSAYAYGVADGLDPAWLLRTHEMLPGPDIAFLLDIDYETSLERRPERRDRYELKGKEYFDRIAGLYRKLWLEIAPLSSFWGSRVTRWVVLNGRQHPDVVELQVRMNIEAQFGSAP